MVVFRCQEKLRGSGHPGPASFLVLMIDGDEFPSAAQIDLNAELCLPPKASSPSCSCHEVSCERSERRSPYIVTTRHCSNSCQVFTPSCQFHYYYFLYLAGPEVGHTSSLWPWHLQVIFLSISSLLLTFSHVDRRKQCKSLRVSPAHYMLLFPFLLSPNSVENLLLTLVVVVLNSYHNHRGVLKHKWISLKGNPVLWASPAAWGALSISLGFRGRVGAQLLLGPAQPWAGWDHLWG